MERIVKRDDVWGDPTGLFKRLGAADELDGALAGEEVMVEHAGGGKHSEAAVLELDELAAGKFLQEKQEKAVLKNACEENASSVALNGCSDKSRYLCIYVCPDLCPHHRPAACGTFLFP